MRINTNKFRAAAKARRGFTLVELLLVMTILAILAGIVLPKLAGKGEKAKIDAAKAQISIFGTALGVYEVETGSYPTTQAGLNALIVRPHDVPAASWHGPYLEKDVPLDPWGKPYVYTRPGRHNPTGYDIYATGPDGTVYGNWTEKAK